MLAASRIRIIRKTINCKSSFLHSFFLFYFLFLTLIYFDYYIIWLNNKFSFVFGFIKWIEVWNFFNFEFAGFMRKKLSFFFHTNYIYQNFWAFLSLNLTKMKRKCWKILKMGFNFHKFKELNSEFFHITNQNDVFKF